MTLTKACVLSALSFVTGVCIQVYETNNYGPSLVWIYGSLYMIGIAFIPVYIGINNLIKKFKK